MITKPKQKSLPVLIKELDTVFSQYIRLKECDNNGIVTCFVTGERVFWADADAAHFIPRANMATRFDEMNVHATTRDTNRYEDPYKHWEKYSIAIIRKYGKVGEAMLEAKRANLMKYSRVELDILISDYKEKVRQLRKDKGL